MENDCILINIKDLKLTIMKKFLIVSTALLMFGFAKAQNAHFGLKGGLNVSNLSIKNDNTRFMAGYHFGALVHIHASNRLGIQPEVTYSAQGGISENINKFRYKLDYINVPVLFQYMVNDGVRIETGPQVGFLLNAKAKAGDVKSDIKKNFENIDFSWGFGVGYITHSKLGFDLRYNLGITDISKNSTVKNNVFQFGIFYQFDKR